MPAGTLHITPPDAYEGSWMQIKTQSFPERCCVEMCQPGEKRQPQESFIAEVSHR